MMFSSIVILPLLLALHIIMSILHPFQNEVDDVRQKRIVFAMFVGVTFEVLVQYLKLRERKRIIRFRHIRGLPRVLHAA